MKKCFVFCIVFLVFIGYLNAFPFANYGNIRVPDARVMPHLMGKISINNYMYPENNLKGDDFAYNWAGAVNIGILNYGEIGFVATGDEVYYAHLKGRILRETLTLPDIAIGLDNAFSTVSAKPNTKDYLDMIDEHNYRGNSMYVAISKTTLFTAFPEMGEIPARVTLGAGAHRFQGTVDFSEQFSGIFGALQFEPMRNLSTIFEIDGHNLNMGAEYSFNNNVSARVDLYRVEEWSRRDPKFALTLSYVFDHYVSPDERAVILPTPRTAAPGDPQIRDRRRETDEETLDELQRIRRQRERAERELEEIRRLLLEED
jgi:hypothetical protein